MEWKLRDRITLKRVYNAENKAGIGKKWIGSGKVLETFSLV